MKAVIIAAIALASFGASAKLSSVQETTTIKCQDLIKRVKRNGFLYLTVNGKPQYPHYKSYYADGSWCSGGDDAVQAWFPTLDGKNCPAAFACVADND
jgi:hypothetical protein